MITARYRHIFACVLLLGLAIPGAANAGGCSLLGSWFGVDNLEDKTLTGWMVTVTGKSESRGNNNFEYSNFDPTFFGYFPTAVRISSSVGTWKRTGGSTFEYTFIGYSIDALNQIVGISKASGEISLSEDCNAETLTAIVSLYDPATSPFTDGWFEQLDFGILFGYRVQLD
jgi:hypothetical protein